MLHVYNSLTRQKERFVPIEPGKIRLYACGVTVYDYFHIGNARMLVVFDTIVRFLRASGYSVTYVRNITDIDDKIIQRANETGEDFRAVTERFTQAMHEDCARLKVLPPDIEPKATETIDEIIAMIAVLIDKRSAYVADNGDVLYDVSTFTDYGKLANKNPADLRAGSRVEVAEGKDDPLDFVLWKKAKPNEPSWPSPWGDGRPGWHIECSAMANRYLGQLFDIHGGGMDLKFPHHENEIAQSEGANGCQFVNYWLHNGFVQIDSEKMSKSLGNFFTVRDVLAQHDPETLRFFLLGSQYRQPLNYNEDSLRNARAGLTRLYSALRAHPARDSARDESEAVYVERFFAAMNDDFNTPEAMAVLFEIAREINREVDASGESERIARLVTSLRDLGGIIGLLQEEPNAFLQSSHSSPASVPNAEQIEQMIADRERARREKNWSEADRIREWLTDHGVVLEDGAGGTRWRIEY